MSFENYIGLLLCFIILINFKSLYGAESKDTCPGRLQNRNCTDRCSNQCGFWNKDLNCKPCESGCVCPPERYETWNRFLNVVCVGSTNKCRCPDGLVYNENGNACTLTCRNPRPRPECQGQKVARCACPPHKPIWHNGKCIKFDHCICKSKSVKSGCNECNKCTCDKGNLVGCTKLSCPDVNTASGATIFGTSGCFRMTTSGACLYYSSCPDFSAPGDCDCETCKRSKELIQDIMAGAGRWGEMNGMCVFTVPGPEPRDSFCNAARTGIVTCNQCNSCECIRGVKICTQKTCPRPERGCFVWRIYPPAQTKCYFVSPCPQRERRCKLSTTLPKITEEKTFCYIFNEKKRRCEFIAPCPSKRQTASICNDCNKCTYKNGVVKCTKKTCGDPLRQGCWNRQSGDQCILTSPCPWDTYGQQCIPNKIPTDEVIMSNGCWIPVYGRCTFTYPCPK